MGKNRNKEKKEIKNTDIGYDENRYQERVIDDNLVTHRGSKEAIYNNEHPDTSCPSLQEFNFCAVEKTCENSCEKVLRGLKGPFACTRMCHPRCQCIPDYISFGSTCIPMETCEFLASSLSMKQKN